MNADENYLLDSMFSAESLHHLVKISHRARTHEGLTNDPTHHLLSPQAALELAERLTQSARLALAEQIKDLRRGDCATCDNFRMVDRPRNGRQWLEHCPDCTELALVPTMPAWAETERKILG